MRLVSIETFNTFNVIAIKVQVTLRDIGSRLKADNHVDTSSVYDEFVQDVHTDVPYIIQL